MPRRVSASTARPPATAAAAAAMASSSSTTTTTTIVAAKSTTAEEGPAAAGPSSKPLPVSLSQAASASASKPGDGSQATTSRPRRVMPSRSRRGGPGVGISDVDTHILETLRRRRENDPLIPAHAQFLLTTNSVRLRTFGEASKGADNEGGSQLNTSAYERYFDKPEVIRAYREQQLIQTPEYTLLSEGDAVGGRFRPRGLDDEGIDTSDAAYEKRHRKYESFEKRQRLREKEKLKHEHYKLKERIEQLRVLESSTFLSAPDSFFSGSLRAPPPQGKPDAQGGVADVPVLPQNEGEWRKRQMLDVANSLEARYRTLLDTAPSRALDQPTETPPPPTAVAPSQTTPIPTLPPEQTPNHVPTTTNTRRSPVPVPVPARTVSPTVLRPQRDLSTSLPLTEVIELDSDGEEKSSEFVKVESASAQPLARHGTTESLKLHIKFPSRPPRPPASSILSQPPPSPSPSSPRLTAARVESGSPNPKGSTSASSSPTRPRPKPIFKNPAAPSQYVRVPFMKRVESQDSIAAAAAADDTTLPILSPLSPQQAETPTVSSNPATHLTLRRRHGRATVHPSPAGIASAGGVTTSGLKQQPPPVHGPGHGTGTGRVRKRRRVELSDEDEEYRGFDIDGDEAIGSGAADTRHEDGREGEDGEDEGSGEEEQQHARWRESALYREAQRHTGTPSARKTHRHLGIFGLKGFPAELEHLHEFAVPEWALPRGDPRVEREREEQEQQEQERRAVIVRGAERARRGGEGAVVPVLVAGAGAGAGAGVDGAGVGDGQRRLRDAVAAKGDGEESSCSKSDQLLVVETASAVDSQVTEVSTLS